MSSARKLEEAQFFLELLDALEQRQRPLTHAGDTAKEASYLFAAILNSFYSVTEVMKKEGIPATTVKDFKDKYLEIYGHGTGERAKTVHIHHVDTASTEPYFTKGTDFDVPRRPPLLIQESRRPGSADFVIGPTHFMDIELLDRRVPVTKFCFDHFYLLRDFHAKCFGASEGDS
jgi:hypothetical protein